MKAVVCTTLGEPNLLEIKDNPIPEPQKNEVLIKVEAAGVNFPDALMVQGKYQIVMDPPFTPGTEVCGIVEGIGEDVEIKIGTKVSVEGQCIKRRNRLIVMEGKMVREDTGDTVAETQASFMIDNT